MYLLKKIRFILPALMVLGGCAELTVSPVEEVQQVQKHKENTVVQPKATPKRSVAKTQSTVLFVCQNGKEVRVQQAKKAKNSKQNTISVTFMDTTHNLSPTVTKDGKKYSNIRWVWAEPRTGKAVLYDNNKKILAKDCVKQL